ncbi:MAG: hypothetical protein M3296_02960 [Actinomycetota bacterium]|nr:hypothetical protein [Actinomycetota bacterium]
MTTALIGALRQEAAFDPTPLPEDLAALHVPFDELLGQERTERALQLAAEAVGRIALVGAMGAGKSSVLAYTLTPARGFAALPISVAPESEQTVTDPARFAQHVVRVTSTWAAGVEMLAHDERDELLRAVADRRILPSRTQQVRAGIALQLPWLAKGELARDIRRELEPAMEVDRSAVEHLQVLRRLTRLIRAIELEPLLVIDDSDRWLRGGEPRVDLVGAFFGRVVRELAELEVGFAVAIHEHYLELPEYRETTPGLLNARVDVPKLTSEEQLAAILDRRIRAFTGEGGSSDVFDPEALARLWQFYRVEANHSLRKTLQIAHTALTDAALAEHDHVGAGLIDAAVAAWPPPHPG